MHVLGPICGVGMHIRALFFMVLFLCGVMIPVFLYYRAYTNSYEPELEMMSEYSGLYADNCNQGWRIQYTSSMCNEMAPKKNRKASPNVRKILSRMNPMVCDDKRKMLFCPVLKSGSTTMLELLVNSTLRKHRGQSLHKASTLHSVGLKYLHEYNEREIKQRLDSYFKFIVVRHPMDRLISTYVDKFDGSGKLHNYFPRYKEQLQKRFGNNFNNDSSGKSHITFEQFLLMISEKDTRKFRNAHWLDYVHSCQPCLLHYDHVIKMETFENDVKVILDKIYTSTKPRIPQRGVHRGLTVVDRFEDMYRFYRTINSSIIDKLKKKYWFDFKIFGYSWADGKPGCVSTISYKKCC